MAKNLTILTIVAAAIFLVLQVCGYNEAARLVRPLIAPLLVILYKASAHVKKSPYLFGFLVLYSISELMEYGVNYFSSDILYFCGNSLYILAYIALILEIVSNIKDEFFSSKYLFQLIVLLVLDSICVYYLTEVTDFKLSLEYFFELFYNCVMMIMMSLAMLSFLVKSTSKSMYMLTGVICLVCSEIFAVAFYYINDLVVFSNAFNIFNIIGISIVFWQNYLDHKEFKFLDQQLEVS